VLHASGLWLNEELIAGHIGIAQRGVCHLGVVSHHPVYARHSPGRVHMLMLADSLCESGVQLLDLTPGGDAYKETLATRHDIVSRLTVYATARDKAAIDRHERVIRDAKRVLGYLGIAPAQARALGEKIQRARVSTARRKLVSAFALLLPTTIEYCVYRFPIEQARALDADDEVAVNNIPDLLGFSPFESWQTRSGFLLSSIERLENDARVYTIAENGQLLHYGWMLVNQTKSQVTEVKQDIAFPAGSVLLYDFLTHPRARGRGLYQRSLRRMLRDAASLPEVTNIYIGAMADNSPSRHVIEKLGFELVRTLRSRRFLRSWSALP
jgi:RimJ/RimL family protein N-acetyltransferase